MSTITIEPATQSRFEDAEHALSGGGDGASCQCQWWLMRGKDWDVTTRPQREQMLHDELASAPTPALIAYVDGEPAGWVRVGPRVRQPRLAHTRAFAATPHAWDDPDVWAVTCFVVRKEYRGQGLNARLLDAAIAHARANGARVLEAYPTDTTVGKTPVNDLYIGILSVFLAAGFHEVARPKPHRTIVELDLAQPA
ncbi:GNAT family N-acetyltransferase [Microbacterium elymi]|uniref:GNAT family N-acetyltransferase n=1 Tax=Microbacterium elymi TaxID=2909587 RepID=A0ABY5NIY3_9MICO|nr:GNAT family N-acetyltransferase [Microbacterium elymi]UUT35137.1 GNAT family N-acetyltransferase [Microbacterium elymi]